MQGGKDKSAGEQDRHGKDVEISMANIQDMIKKIRPSAQDIVVGNYLSFLSKYGQR